MDGFLCYLLIRHPFESVGSDGVECTDSENLFLVLHSFRRLVERQEIECEGVTREVMERTGSENDEEKRV